MGLFDRLFRRENRTLTAQNQPGLSPQAMLERLGVFELGSSTGMVVTTDTALGVSAVWAAVNFMSGTLASFPLHVYRRSGDNRTKVNDNLARVLHDAVNDELSSFDWRKRFFVEVFTNGRGLTFIERNKLGKVINLWPLDPMRTTIALRDGRRVYTYREGKKESVFTASEIIDIAFMLRSDGYTSRPPLLTNADAVGLAISVNKYGNRFFANGGVPPFAITGQFQSPGAMQRASDDMAGAVRNAASQDRQTIVLPAGLEIKTIGIDPEKSQLVNLKRFSIEEIARIYSLPPTFLQDLTHGTYSNSEQQDLHFVKHTISQWVQQFEQELNLKLFGRNNKSLFAEMNIDGLLRGDFMTRMNGYASGIQNAILTPNEARRRENLPDAPDGDRLLIQGATVPLGSQPAATPTDPAPVPADIGDPTNAQI